MQNRGRGEGVRSLLLSPLHAPRGASIPSALSRLRILPVTTGVYVPRQHPYSRLRRLCVSVSLWQIPCSHKLTASLSVSLPSFPRSLPLFSRACSLFLQNTRGGGSLQPFSAARHFASRYFPDGYNACSACSTLFVRAVGSIAGFTHRHG